ncbi:hypothetical protein [Verrucosispora sioxanthis]|uniref:hypothetical protein n=1 Tax=Verrucosispora sioxanthis TaxID=2499994 RepID=UPI00209D60F0|nr:hypothetical protein [Verrucosispora sioxanthis]
MSRPSPPPSRGSSRRPAGAAADTTCPLLLASLRTDHAEQAGALYRTGDAAEKRAVLKALPMLPIGAAGTPLLHDAIAERRAAGRSMPADATELLDRLTAASQPQPREV